MWEEGFVVTNAGEVTKSYVLAADKVLKGEEINAKLKIYK